MKKTILIVSHGSREKSANRQFERIVGHYQKRHVSWKVSHAYLDLIRPSILKALEALARESNEIIVLPYFLFAARHVKEDIPEIIKAFRKKHPRVKVELAKPLGSDPKLLKILDQRLAETAF